MVTELARRYTKKGDLMATFVLEDLNASIEVFVFPKSMADYGALLDDDAIVVLKGRVDLRDDRLKLVCMEVQRPELAADGNSDLRISLPVNSLTDRTVEDLKRLLIEHPGDAAVFLHVGEKVLRLPPEFNVDSRRGLVGELRVLLGPNAIQTCTAADAGRRCDRGRQALRETGARARGSGPGGARFGPRRTPDTTGASKSRKISFTAPGVESHTTRPGPSGPAVWCPRQNGAGGARRRETRSTERPMSIQVETKDCTSISDAELAEMADLCAEREPRFDIGFLSKQREEWVLVTRAREGTKLRGYSFSTLERIGGTPSLLIGLATVDRTSRADTVLRGMMGDKYRRALLAFPDEDVLVGTRLLGGRGLPGLRRADRRGARPRPQGHRRGAGLGTPAGQALRSRRPDRRPHLRGGRRRRRGRWVRLHQPQGASGHRAVRLLRRRGRRPAAPAW